MLDKILLHPIALLGILKKYPISYIKEKSKRIIGSLLGYKKKKKISCTSSFRIPFEKDMEGNSWFLDHDFMEKMAEMYKKVNAKEIVIGWYSESKELNEEDINISKMFFSYTKHPVNVLIWKKNNKGLLIQAFFTKNNFFNNTPVFSNIPVAIGMLESEEIGIFQILKNSTPIKNLILTNSIKKCLRIVVSYIKNVKKSNKINNSSNLISKKYNMEIENFQKILEKIINNLKFKNLQKKTKNGYFFWYASVLIKIFLAVQEKYIDCINFK